MYVEIVESKDEIDLLPGFQGEEGSRPVRNFKVGLIYSLKDFDRDNLFHFLFTPTQRDIKGVKSIYLRHLERLYASLPGVNSKLAANQTIHINPRL